jgi:hypothetical protein
MRLLTKFEKLEGCGPSQPSFRASEAPSTARDTPSNLLIGLPAPGDWRPPGFRTAMGPGRNNGYSDLSDQALKGRRSLGAVIRKKNKVGGRIN